jgi:hypothetical protein
MVWIDLEGINAVLQIIRAVVRGARWLFSDRRNWQLLGAVGMMLAGLCIGAGSVFIAFEVPHPSANETWIVLALSVCLFVLFYLAVEQNWRNRTAVAGECYAGRDGR